MPNFKINKYSAAIVYEKNGKIALRTKIVEAVSAEEAFGIALVYFEENDPTIKDKNISVWTVKNVAAKEHLISRS